MADTLTTHDDMCQCEQCEVDEQDCPLNEAVAAINDANDGIKRQADEIAKLMFVTDNYRKNGWIGTTDALVIKDRAETADAERDELRAKVERMETALDDVAWEAYRQGHMAGYYSSNDAMGKKCEDDVRKLIAAALGEGEAK